MRYLTFTLAALFVFAAVSSAQAAMVLTIDDLATPGVDVIIVDGAPAGTATAKGPSTIPDPVPAPPSPGAGVITFVGPVGPNFLLNIIAALSKPAIGPPIVSLSVTSTSVLGGGTLSVMLTDTGFSKFAGDPAAFLVSDASVTSMPPGSTLSTSALYDPADMEFGIGGAPTILGQGPFPTIAAPLGSTATAPLPAPPPPSYSLTSNILLTHGAAGSTISAGHDVSLATPEPTSLALFGIGAVSLIGYGVRRRRKNQLETVA